MSGNCEFKRKVCTEMLTTNEGRQSVLELIEKFISSNEDHSGPICACGESFVQNRPSDAYRVAEVYSASGVFHTCTRCREKVMEHLSGMGIVRNKN